MCDISFAFSNVNCILHLHLCNLIVIILVKLKVNGVGNNSEKFADIPPYRGVCYVGEFADALYYIKI